MRFRGICDPLERRRLLMVAAVTLALLNLLLLYLQRLSSLPAVLKTSSWTLRSSHSSPPPPRLHTLVSDDRLLNTQGLEHFPPLFDLNLTLLPHDSGANLTDRILNQMRYIPPNYKVTEDKVIFVEDSNPFTIDVSMCPVKKCKFTFNIKDILLADAVLLRSFIYLPKSYLPHQIVIVYQLESPSNFDLSHYKNIMNTFNWTATYRFDASIVSPYYKVTSYNNLNPWPDRYPYPDVDYSITRKIPIAWFVSNCNTKNNRSKLAQLLGKYLQVDMYGACSNLECLRDNEEFCFNKLQNYWFYLSFENSNCRHYITEKFYRNALSSSVLPIVLGAHPEDYKLVAPPHSYIHIEDFSNIHLLVRYLKYLMKNKTAYNEYFAWKNNMKVDTDTFFWCRLCTMVTNYAGTKLPDVPNMRKWWSKNMDCLATPWVIKKYW